MGFCTPQDDRRPVASSVLLLLLLLLLAAAAAATATVAASCVMSRRRVCKQCDAMRQQRHLAAELIDRTRPRLASFIIIWPMLIKTDFFIS
jgi:hypothetical protein